MLRINSTGHDYIIKKLFLLIIVNIDLNIFCTVECPECSYMYDDPDDAMSPPVCPGFTFGLHSPSVLVSINVSTP